MPGAKSGQALLVRERQGDVPQRLVTLDGHINRWVSRRPLVSFYFFGRRLLADNGGGARGLAWRLGGCWARSVTPRTRLLPPATPISSFLTLFTSRIRRRRELHL